MLTGESNGNDIGNGNGNPTDCASPNDNWVSTGNPDGFGNGPYPAGDELGPKEVDEGKGLLKSENITSFQMFEELKSEEKIAKEIGEILDNEEQWQMMDVSDSYNMNELD